MTTDELNHAARQIMPAAPAGFTPATDWQHAHMLVDHVGQRLRMLDQVKTSTGAGGVMQVEANTIGSSITTTDMQTLTRWLIGVAEDYPRLRRQRATIAGRIVRQQEVQRLRNAGLCD